MKNKNTLSNKIDKLMKPHCYGCFYWTGKGGAGKAYKCYTNKCPAKVRDESKRKRVIKEKGVFDMSNIKLKKRKTMRSIKVKYICPNCGHKYESRIKRGDSALGGMCCECQTPDNFYEVFCFIK